MGKKKEKIFKSYLGLDLSLTATGYCLINSEYDVIDKGVIKTGKRRGMERIDYIRNKLYKYLKKPENISIEGYSFASRGRGLVNLGELGGIIRFTIFKEDDINYYFDVPPTRVKKFISGSGKSKKSEILMYCLKKYDKEFHDDNIADAFVLAVIAREVARDEINNDLYKYQKKIIKDIKKNLGNKNE